MPRTTEGSSIQGRSIIADDRGPKAAHKLTAEVVQFVRKRRQADPELRASALVRLIARHFRVIVHPRSIERALARSQKKRSVAP